MSSSSSEGAISTLSDSKTNSKSSISIDRLVNDFLQYCEVEKNLSQGTIKMYHFYLKEFVLWIDESKHHDVVSYKEISQDVIRDFRLHLNRKISEKSNKPIRFNTQNRYLTALRSFLRYLIVERGFNSVLAPDKVVLGKSEPRVPKFLNENQINDLVRVQDLSKKSGVRDRSMLELLFSTGMRISELSGLNRDDLSHQIIDKREFAIVGKGRKLRTVYLSEAAAKWLKKYIATRKDPFKPLFVRYSGKVMDDNDRDGQSLRLTPRSIQRMVKKYARMAGLSVDVTPHVLRHSFATDLLMSGADLRSVQELLGHSDVSTTQIYTHVTNKHLKEVHEKFHSRDSET